jgi:queuine/archaeosine tRNA-ribosyltransferase
MVMVSTLHRGADYSSLKKVDFGNKNLITPTYFASITSASSRAPLWLLLQTFLEHDYTKLLISSYDIYHSFGSYKKETIQLLNNFAKDSKFLFLDSGLFELDHFQKDNWTISNYSDIVKDVNSDFFAGFDVFATSDKEHTEIVNETIEQTKKSYLLQNNNLGITICHGNDVDEICDLINKLADENPSYLNMIAVSERDIGKNIRSLYFGIKKIRETLNQYSSDNLIHLLGCGDPLSIAILSYAGVDSFDAVDWNRWLINRNTLSYSNQNLLPLTSCDCTSCKNITIKEEELIYKHNLTFYQDFTTDLQTSIFEDLSMINFLKRWNVDQVLLDRLENYFYP